MNNHTNPDFDRQHFLSDPAGYVRETTQQVLALSTLIRGLTDEIRNSRITGHISEDELKPAAIYMSDELYTASADLRDSADEGPVDGPYLEVLIP